MPRPTTGPASTCPTCAPSPDQRSRHEGRLVPLRRTRRPSPSGPRALGHGGRAQDARALEPVACLRATARPSTRAACPGVLGAPPRSAATHRSAASPSTTSRALHPGHATISITLGVHQHALPTLQREPPPRWPASSAAPDGRGYHRSVRGQGSGCLVDLAEPLTCSNVMGTRCGRGESNPHARRHQILSLAWLPLHHSRVSPEHREPGQWVAGAARAGGPWGDERAPSGAVWQAVARASRPSTDPAGDRRRP
jgi:hypothetical protein